MIECLKVHEYICKKSSKLNHKWHILSYYIEKERKILIPTYVKHIWLSLMVVCPEIAGFSHNIVA